MKAGTQTGHDCWVMLVTIIRLVLRRPLQSRAARSSSVGMKVTSVPNFASSHVHDLQAVILLFEHSETGSAGVILNKPMDQTIGKPCKPS